MRRFVSIDERHVTKLSSRARSLPVQVHVRAGDAEQVFERRSITDEVEHDRLAERLRRAERESENSANVILELARHRAVDRPVARVVDARRELVREQPPLDLEQLDGQHADVAERVEELRRDLLGLTLRRAGRGSARDRQDPASVLVLGERVEGGLAVAAARRDDRQLAIERNDLLRELVVVEHDE